MTRVRRSIRRVVPVLAVALAFVVMPIAPVVAQPSAADTKAAVIEVLAADVPAEEVANPDADSADHPTEEAAEADSHAEGEADEAQEADAEDGTEDDAQVGERSEVTEAPFPFSGLGFRGDGSAPTMSFRVLEPAGEWTDWTAVEYVDRFDGPDEGSAEAGGADAPDWVSEPIWVGEATHLQIDVVGATLEDVEANVVDTMGLSETVFRRAARHVGSLGTPPAEASVSQPTIVDRRGWGADESWRKGSPSYREPEAAVLHHTATSNSYTSAQAAGQVRNMYHWHTQGNGWNDLGYNFVVDRFGTIYEGRAGGITQGVIGAHAGGWNTGTVGVAIMGNHNTAAVSSAAFNAAAEVLAWKFGLHGIDPNPASRVTMNGYDIRRLESHRNVRGSYRSDVGGTDCPGSWLYPRMNELRDLVNAKSATNAGPTVAPGSWVPIAGDWNGDGRTTAGWFREGTWRLRNSNSTGTESVRFRFGSPGDRPVVGDWNGNGRTTIGVVRDGHWHLRNANSGGSASTSFWFGRGVDWPLAGDWNGNGRDGPGIVRYGEWHLRNAASSGAAQHRFTYGRVTQGDIPLVGDWNRNGRDAPAILRDGSWHLRNSLSGGAGQISFTYGRVALGDVPVVGDWNRDGRTTVGVTRAGVWHLRNSLSNGPANTSFTYR